MLRLRGGSDLSELRIVALSTFETWGGRHPKNMISDVNLCFRERVPLTSAVDFYALENELESLSQQNGIWLRIVGYGLFYGSSGMDLHALFM